MQTRRCTGRCTATRHVWRGMVTVKDCFVPGRLYSVMSIDGDTPARRLKTKRCSEPSPGTNLRRSIDLAARFDDCISEPAFKPVHCNWLGRHNLHSFQLRLKGLQKFSKPTIKR